MARLSGVERMLNRVQLQIAAAQAMVVSDFWRFDLFSPFWRLYVNNRAGAGITFRGKRIALTPGRVYLIPAWVRFATHTIRPVKQYYIHFYLSGLPPTLLRRIFDHPLWLERTGILKELSDRWQHGLEREPGPAEVNWAYALAHAALAMAMERLSSTDQRDCFRWLSESNVVRPALECVDSRLAQPPDNEELARLCHMSSDHFIRKFRETVGMTPARYGLEWRLSIAAQWLTGTERTIEEIAEATGFTDRFHFSRVFKKRFTVPPVSYRRRHLS